ncbi:acyl-CoA carboxylase subunit epsilon [Kytococcus schroeteri]|nr:acyl-CoA carboxylase subunit epsilon [Kytococcus schroeteri]
MSPATREAGDAAAVPGMEDAASTAAADAAGTAGEPVVTLPADASAEEVAALTVVFSALGGGEAPAVERTNRWGVPGSGVRGAVVAGPGAWRASGLPR